MQDLLFGRPPGLVGASVYELRNINEGEVDIVEP